MQTNQTASRVAWRIWQMQAMQELSGATQMTLLIIILSLSAQLLQDKVNSHWKANER
jgi:hypothetical protein